GIAILTAEPWRALHALVYTMIALVLSGLAWSFIGRADVIVTEQGALAPASELRRFYAPVDGELANLYVAEGQPVAKGDVLARLNARGAVEAASNAMQAQLKLENAEREWRQFPEKKALLEQKAATLRQAMELEEQQHQKRTALGTSKLLEEQKAQMAEARTNVEETRRARDAAQLEVEKFERVLASPGGSGVSQLQVESKRNARLAAENAYRMAQSRVNELTARQSQELVQAQAQLESSGEQLKKLRLDYEAAANELATAEEKLRLQLNTARVEADAAARIRFENIDKDNFLQIVAPVSGVVTDLTSTQPGDKVQANTPLGGIAPSNSRSVVKVEIAENDRAFLREGLPVKLKFNAFPYQRYGAINGTLEYVSPATKPASQTKQPVYEARISLERDYYQVAETRYPLRYGMTAAVEIVVRQRRLIDLALDPFRQVGG
ncbi:MAG: HlyD family efflux transporter periplasmic adaptor subunit, partial [Gammaproteobacteria bacterium]|nr:HlyD family efflux transporter periplasmic adaptor subunit [Gammaproteobacteria bacterium]